MTTNEWRRLINLIEGSEQCELSQEKVANLTLNQDIDFEKVVAIDLEDETPWEFLGANLKAGGEVSKSINCTHFYRRLSPCPDHWPVINERPRILRLIAENLKGRDREEYEEATSALSEVFDKVSLSTVNVESLTRVIRQEGIDALILIAHGDGSALVFGQSEQGKLGFHELEAALSENERPLRFAFLMLCESRRPLLDMLQRLGTLGKLHPQFGGVVMWGSPRTKSGYSFTAAFLRGLLEDPDSKYPFLKAVQCGRQAVKAATDGFEKYASSAPIALAFHPHASPLPSYCDWEMENYLCHLAAEDTALDKNAQ